MHGERGLSGKKPSGTRAGRGSGFCESLMRGPWCQWYHGRVAAWGPGTGDSKAPTSAAHSELGVVPGDSGMLPDLTTSFPALSSQSGVCCLQVGALTHTPSG